MSIEILDGRESLDGGSDTMTGFRIPVVSDVVDKATEALEALWDQLDDLPGFRELGEGTKALFKGPLRDFAKTSVGQTVLRAMTTVAMGPAGALAGPWAMMAAASLPGVLTGSPFEEALISENLYRATEAVKILTANQVKVPGIEFPIPPEVERIGTQSLQVLNNLKERAAQMGLPIEQAVAKMAEDYGVPNNLEALGLKLAAELGVREDFAVQALEMAAKQKLLTHENYDLATGKRRDPLREAVAAATSRTMATSYATPALLQRLSTPTSKTVATSSSTPGLMQKLAFLQPPPSPIQKSVVSPIAKTSLQVALDALRADQQASRAAMPPPAAESELERFSVLDARSFWEKHKTKVMVGTGLVAAAGLAYLVWRRK